VKSKYKTYGQYLKSYVNKSDGTLISYIELEILMVPSNEKYLIRRNWNGKGQKAQAEIKIYQNDEYNSFLTDNWAMFIENILPSGLSNFFFFNGEKIGELAEEDTNEQMKDSIKTLLGINVLDTLKGDLRRITSKITRANEQKYNTAESNDLRVQRDTAETKLIELDNQIKSLIDKSIVIEKELEKARVNYASKGGDIVAKEQELFQKRMTIAAKIEQNANQLLDIAGLELPLSLVPKLLFQIKEQSSKEREERESQVVIKKINAFYDQYKKASESEAVEEFVKYIKQQSNDQRTEMIFNLSDLTYLQLTNLCDHQLTNTKKNTELVIEEQKNNQAKADEIDSYLSVEIDEKVISKIYKKIVILEKQKTNLEVEIDNCNKKRPSLNGDVMSANAEFNRYVENMLSKLEWNDDNNRVVKYAHYATDVLDEYKVRLQSRKIGVLAETMTNCYKKLANKKSLIDKVDINPRSLDFCYLDENESEVEKTKLSAGEKQLMVVSLLWALAICSKRKLPVIIDTPLSRLDSKHRISLIRTYFPHASDQTIILSTDSEIYGKYYDAIKENVGDEFILHYDDDKKCTTISTGYFTEDGQW